MKASPHAVPIGVGPPFAAASTGTNSTDIVVRVPAMHRDERSLRPASGRGRIRPRVPARPLWQQDDEGDDEGRDDRGGERPAQVQPPSAVGLSRKSPTMAPSGRVRMKAAQNRATRDTEVR